MRNFPEESWSIPYLFKYRKSGNFHCWKFVQSLRLRNLISRSIFYSDFFLPRIIKILRCACHSTCSCSCLCQVSWIFPVPSYCTFYSTSPSQKQWTHPRQLLRQMSYDSSFLFYSHSVWIGSVFGLSFAHQRLFNHSLLYFFIYVVASNTIPFEKLFHGSYSLRTFFPTSHLL